MLINRVIRRFGIWLSYVFLVSTSFVCFLFFRFPFNFTRVKGRANIPRKRNNVIFVANHDSMYDSFMIGIAAYFPEMIYHPSHPFMNFAAKENYFLTWFHRFFFSLLRTVPVERRDQPWLMRKYVQYLEKNNLLIFYQGTRSKDLTKIRNGIAYAIVHAKDTPIVIPVYHEGMDRIFFKGGPGTTGISRWLPQKLFRKPKVVFGTPIDFSDAFSIQEIKDRITAVNRRIVESMLSLKTQHAET